MSVIFIVSMLHTPQVQANSNQKDINDIREYVEKNVPKLVKKLSKLQNKTTSLEEIQKVIDQYYKKNPSPDAMNDPSINLKDVFPEKAKEAQPGDKFVINEFISNQKQVDQDGRLLEFNIQNGKVNVFVGDTGEIVILQQKTEEENKELSKIQTSQITMAAASGPRITSIESTTGIGYSAAGGKMYTLQAEGQFSYTGSDVNVYYGDGYWQRHLWGSTLSISDRGMGKSKKYNTGGYTYAEVYSRLYVEAQYGFRWAGITMNSNTVEAYVGSTVTGNLYGGLTTR